MTIANIQNMVVRQGPLQRLFGISDLEVHTAGGGSGSAAGEDPMKKNDSFHVGRLRGLENASALRDKIREQLQAVKGEAGGRAPGEVAALGPGDRKAAGSEKPGDLGAAARALLAEARALRRSFV